MQRSQPSPSPRPRLQPNYNPKPKRVFEVAKWGVEELTEGREGRAVYKSTHVANVRSEGDIPKHEGDET